MICIEHTRCLSRAPQIRDLLGGGAGRPSLRQSLDAAPASASSFGRASLEMPMSPLGPGAGGSPRRAPLQHVTVRDPDPRKEVGRMDGDVWGWEGLGWVRWAGRERDKGRGHWMPFLRGFQGLGARPHVPACR